MQFHYHLIVHQKPSKFYTICNDSNLMISGLSNDNEIALNLNHYQFINKITYLYTFPFLRFFSFYLKTHCQDCQNNHY
jgi:hypothetical protein